MFNMTTIKRKSCDCACLSNIFDINESKSEITLLKNISNKETFNL